MIWIKPKMPCEDIRQDLKGKGKRENFGIYLGAQVNKEDMKETKEGGQKGTKSRKEKRQR